jgi:hypothetical protein
MTLVYYVCVYKFGSKRDRNLCFLFIDFYA